MFGPNSAAAMIGVSPGFYCPVIGGLRAVAVPAVFLFHCFPIGLAGGFIRVNVFFVISGYLVGLSSFEEIAAGHYSAPAYFGHRASSTPLVKPTWESTLDKLGAELILENSISDRKRL